MWTAAKRTVLPTRRGKPQGREKGKEGEGDEKAALVDVFDVGDYEHRGAGYFTAEYIDTIRAAKAIAFETIMDAHARIWSARSVFLCAACAFSF